MPTTAGRAYFIASPPWATTTAAPSSCKETGEAATPRGAGSPSKYRGLPNDRDPGRTSTSGGPLEEPEQCVANMAGLVESVDQDARRALCTSAARRRDDVHNQRGRSVVPEMRRHLRASFPWFSVVGDGTVAAKLRGHEGLRPFATIADLGGAGTAARPVAPVAESPGCASPR